MTTWYFFLACRISWLLTCLHCIIDRHLQTYTHTIHTLGVVGIVEIARVLMLPSVSRCLSPSLSVCLVCVYVYVYIWMYVYVSVYVYVCKCMCICMYVLYVCLT